MIDSFPSPRGHWLVGFCESEDEPGSRLELSEPRGIGFHLYTAANDHVFFEQGLSRGIDALNGRRSVEVVPALSQAIERIGSTRTRADCDELLPILKSLLDDCSKFPLHHLHACKVYDA